MEFPNDLIKGSIVPIVLSLLRDRPMYGYEMVKVVNARTNGRLEWKEGTLYPTLHRLEAGRLISSRWMDAPTDQAPGRKRKYYSIRSRGLAELAKRSEQWREFSTAVSTIVLGA